MTTFEVPLWINSNPEAGARNLSSDGSTFQTVFDPYLRVPSQAKNPRIAVVASDIWYSTINVSTERKNNTFTFTDDLGDPTKYVITFPDGLYTIGLLNSMLDLLIQQEGLAAGLFTLGGVTATQHGALTINQAGWQVNASTGDDPTSVLRESGFGLMGFDSQKFPTAALTVSPDTFVSEHVANFGLLSSYRISSPTFGGGLRFNGRESNALCSVPVGNSSPQSLISMEFTTPLWCPIGDKIGPGSTVTQAMWELTDQDGNRVNTNSEYWNARLILAYELEDSEASSLMLSKLTALATR